MLYGPSVEIIKRHPFKKKKKEERRKKKEKEGGETNHMKKENKHQSWGSKNIYIYFFFRVD